tara:strand:- start:2796 stop:2975 length:180 start_codon:yes stop_codon:yes gene_type:complete
MSKMYCCTIKDEEECSCEEDICDCDCACTGEHELIPQSNMCACGGNCSCGTQDDSEEDI